MGEHEGFIEFVGSLWELIRDTAPEDILEPSYPALPTEMVLGQMLEIEKILFTIREEFFGALILLFKIDSQDAEAIFEFDIWLFNARREEFIARCQEGGHDVTLFLETRKQFFDVHDFLEIVTAQHFSVDKEEFMFYYRKGSLVSIQKANLFQTSDN
jgi:hypothetical protein